MSAQSEANAPGLPDGHSESRVKVARNALNLVLGQVATTVLAVLLSAALGRKLGPADFGLYFLILTTSQFAFVIVEWGQGLYVVREMSRDATHMGRFLGSALALRALAGVLIAGPVGLATLAWGYDVRTSLYAGAFVLASLPFSLAQGFGMAFRSRDQMGNEAVVSVANKTVVLALTLAALGVGMGIPGVMIAQAVAGLVALGFAFRLYLRLDAGRLEFDRGDAKSIVVGGTSILVMLITVSVQPYLDAVILSHLAPPEVVGWYGAAKNVMGTLVAPAMILGAAWYPRLSRVTNDPPAFKRELRAALRPMLWLGALGGIGTYEFAEFAIRLIFGLDGYGPAVAVLQVFGLGLFLLFVDVLLGHVITAAGKSTGFAVAKVLSVLAAVALQLWLVPWFQANQGNGGIGVVVSFAASEVIVFAGVLVLLPRGALGPVILLDVARAGAAAGLTAVAWRFIPAMSPVIGIPVCIALFTAASMVVGLMSKSDISLLLQTIRKKKPDAA